MFKNMKLGTKLLVAFLAVGVLPFAVIGISSLIKASNALETQAFNQLEGVRGIKKAQIEQFFAEREGDMGVLVETVSTLRSESFRKLEAVQKIKKHQIESYFNDRFKLLDDVQQNLRFTEGVKLFTAAFSKGMESPEYRKLSAGREKGFSIFMENFGFYDVFLISAKGDVVYTVTKEADLGANLRTGALKNSGLGRVFEKSRNQSAFDDFTWYGPSNEPAAFIATPLIDKSGKYRGSAAFQISLNDINFIMQERSGMGNTGETYLVGPDKLMRSDSYLDPQYHSVTASFKDPLKGKVDTEASRNALSGQEGAEVIMDYNGNPVLSVYSPMKIGDVTWAFIAEIDVAEAFSPVDENGNEFYKKYVEMYGYYDLFLFNPDGTAFYTAARESDYQTNFANGKYSNSNLGKLFREVMQTKRFGVADFAPYAPSNNEPCGFIAQPVVYGGKVELVVGLQLSLDAINNVMQQRDGMGETGETYLVGSDKLMRSDSFLDPTNHSVKASFANPNMGSVDTEAAKQALSGETESKIIIDYNGNPVLSAYTPLKIGDNIWALIAEIDEAEAFAAVKALKWIIGVVFVIGVCAIVGLALLITRSITGPINQAVTMVNEMGMGHLDMRLNMDRTDEIGQMATTMDKFADDLQGEVVTALEKLADGDLTFDATPKDEADVIGTALKKTGDDLNRTVGEILSATEQIAAGSGQVSDSSQSLSQGATEQAASLEEITSSMTEMASQTKTNAENATQANQLAGQARSAADTGSEQMQEMVAAMGEINEAGKNISRIIKVIDEIAFQTNLLALNAAVEAARAGRHGKGFAVVAEEVRNLAARSAKAAKETAELIEGSVQKTEKGAEIANRTAESLAEIVNSVTKTTDLVGEIAAASNEQAQGISQVNQGLGQIDQVTQQNTANAEEGAAAAEELSGQAAHLKSLMAQFKIRGGSTAAATVSKALPHGPQVSSGGAAGQGWDEQAQIPHQAPAENPADVIALNDKEFGKY